MADSRSRTSAVLQRAAAQTEQLATAAVSQPSPLQLLPEELLQKVLHHLASRDMALLACTCCALRDSVPPEHIRCQRARDLLAGAQCSWHDVSTDTTTHHLDDNPEVNSDGEIVVCEEPDEQVWVVSISWLIKLPYRAPLHLTEEDVAVLRSELPVWTLRLCPQASQYDQLQDMVEYGLPTYSGTFGATLKLTGCLFEPLWSSSNIVGTVPNSVLSDVTWLWELATAVWERMRTDLVSTLRPLVEHLKPELILQHQLRHKLSVDRGYREVVLEVQPAL